MCGPGRREGEALVAFLVCCHGFCILRHKHEVESQDLCLYVKGHAESDEARGHTIGSAFHLFAIHLRQQRRLKLQLHRLVS